jgi:hypothetical protein
MIVNFFKINIEVRLFKQFRLFIDKRYRGKRGLNKMIKLQKQGDIVAEKEMTLDCAYQLSEVMVTRHFLYKILMWLSIPIALLFHFLALGTITALIPILLGISFFFLARRTADKVRTQEWAYDFLKGYYENQIQENNL